MNIAPTLIALQTIYMIHKHNEEEEKDDDYYDDDDD